MALEPFEEVQIVGNNAPGVEKAAFRSDKRVLLTTPVQRIAVHVGTGVIAPLFGIVLGAGAVFHTRAGRVEETTGAVDHVTFDELVKMRLRGRIGQLGRHEPVDLGWRAGVIGLDEDEEEVDMWEASFLEFDHVRPCESLSEDAFNSQGCQKHLEFGVEHSGNQVWAILRLLARPKICSNLGPFGIRGASDEEVGAPESRHEAHGVEV